MHLSHPPMLPLVQPILARVHLPGSVRAFYLEGPLALCRDDGCEWAVLGVLRLYYTLREHAITSKTGAGRCALAHLPARWRPLIEEVIALRDSPPGARGPSAYPTKIHRAGEALIFLRAIIRGCSVCLDASR